MHAPAVLLSLLFLIWDSSLTYSTTISSYIYMYAHLMLIFLLLTNDQCFQIQCSFYYRN